MCGQAEETKGEPKKNLYFHFLLSPLRFLANEKGHVSGIELARNELQGEAGNQKAVPTHEKETLAYHSFPPSAPRIAFILLRRARGADRERVVVASADVGCGAPGATSCSRASATSPSLWRACLSITTAGYVRAGGK